MVLESNGYGVTSNFLSRSMRPVVSHCCHSVVTLLLHWCYTGVTLVLHCRHTVVTLLIQGCYTGVTVCIHEAIRHAVRLGLLCVCVCVSVCV
jgi:hypothetical protein